MPQCSDDVRDINVRLARVEQDISAIKTAFVRNDLEHPDYDGHRTCHHQLRRESAHRAEKVQGYLDGFTQKIVMGAIGVALAVFGAGVVPYLRGLLGLV